MTINQNSIRAGSFRWECTDGVLRCRPGMQTAERQTRLLSREMTGIAGIRTKAMINTVSTPAACHLFGRAR